jgi:hypothetical protein
MVGSVNLILLNAPTTYASYVYNYYFANRKNIEQANELLNKMSQNIKASKTKAGLVTINTTQTTTNPILPISRLKA